MWIFINQNFHAVLLVLVYKSHEVKASKRKIVGGKWKSVDLSCGLNLPITSRVSNLFVFLFHGKLSSFTSSSLLPCLVETSKSHKVFISDSTTQRFAKSFNLNVYARFPFSLRINHFEHFQEMC